MKAVLIFFLFFEKYFSISFKKSVAIVSNMIYNFVCKKQKNKLRKKELKMKNLEKIIKKETKRGVRFYRYKKDSSKLSPIKKIDVEAMMSEGIVEIIDAEGNVVWTPLLEEVTVETVEVEETEEMRIDFERAENLLDLVREYKNMIFYPEAQVHYGRYKKAGGSRVIIHLEYPVRYKELLEESDDVKKYS